MFNNDALLESKNSGLSKAKSAKKDEFYTQYNDIEKEMQAYLDYDANVFRGKIVFLPCDDPDWSNFTKYFAQNFERFGLKKLISTSYAHTSTDLQADYQPSLFETQSPNYDKDKSVKQGKIFILDKDSNHDGKVDIKDLQWHYLNGTGDFKTDEIKALQDEVDIIITNPPFSLFREFLAWIVEADKQFSIIGNMNAITCKDIFSLIKNNEAWLGATINSGDREFRVPENYPLEAAGFRIDDEGNKYLRVKGIRWFTNIDYGRRHQPLQLMTMAENFKFNKKIQGKNAYQKYDNYNAIEVPVTIATPSDYKGIMGVPISFLDKHNPEQFKIIGMDLDVKNGLLSDLAVADWNGKLDRAYIKGNRMYSRILIQAE